MAEKLPSRPSHLILERLRSTTNKQRLDTLMRLESACDALERARTELSFANIGRKAWEEFNKGPTAQSVKNDPGMKEYVLARRDERLAEAESDPGRRRRRPATATATQIERISDQTLRAKMRVVYADHLEVRRRFADIQAALLLIAPGVDVDTLMRRYKANPGAPVSIQPNRSTPVHTPEDVEGLRSILALFDTPSYLGRFDLQNDGKRIKRTRGIQEEFIPLKVFTALRRLYKALANTPAPAMIDIEAAEVE